MKKIITLILAMVVIFSFAGCGVEIKSTDTTAGQTATAAPALPNTATVTEEASDAPTIPSTAPSELTAAVPSPTPTTEPTPPPVRVVVFDQTRSDNTLADNNEPNAFSDSTETFKATLYETSPNVFEGEAICDITVKSGSDVSENDSEMYYRTERVKLTPGVGQNVTLIFATQAANTTLEWSEAPALGKMTRHNNGLQYQDFTWILEIDGDTAKLSFGADDTEPYIGKCVMLPHPAETDFQGVPVGKAISVNSDGRQVRGQVNGHEYRGILTAETTGNNSFVGNLFIYGDGPGVPFCDEDISFTMEAFDARAYKDAGGSMPVSADAMGVIHTAAGNYILLQDGDRVFLEVPGSDVTFLGGLIPESGAERAKFVADETKPIVKFLYDGTKEKTQTSVGSLMKDGIPAWYPVWLMPKPISAMNERYNTVVDDGGYNIYSFQYNEDQRGGTSAKAIMENYKAQLAGADGLEAIYDEESHYAIVRFNKGAYSIHILLSPPFMTVNVTVDIIH